MTDERKKLIFLDIDGTLTAPGSNVPPASALTAIRGAQAKGHKVFLCSGRNRGMLSPLLRYGFDGFVASGGGFVVCGDEVLLSSPMTAQQQERALRVLRDNGIFCTVECSDVSYTDESFKDYLEAHSDVPGNSELLRWRQQIESDLGIRPMAEYDGAPIYKIILLAVEEEGLQNALTALGDDYHIVIQDRTASGIINGELQSPDFDKGVGIRKVCEYLHFPIEDTIGYGDSMNDREMLETVGLSVCMGNGSAAMKALADEVCGSVLEDGLYNSFVQHGLL